MYEKKLEIPTCSFCGKAAKYAGRMLSGIERKYICEECVFECYETLVGDKTKKQNIEKVKVINPRDIKRHLDEYIVGQEVAKKTLAVAAYNHYNRIKIQQSSSLEMVKSNVLLIGPTGSGKTYMVKILSKILDVPFIGVDATAFTEAGYAGDNVENILYRLYKAANNDIERAEKGMVYIDEIDKIAKKNNNGIGNRDISGEGVQQALLKILEGTEVTIQDNSEKEEIKINTKDILFICSGAFSGIDKIVKKRMDKVEIGFCSKKSEKENENNIEVEDLSKYGIISEFIGRLPIIVQLSELCQCDLKEILIRPKDAIVRQYQELFSHNNVLLDFEDDALEEVAQIAYNKKNGARGLRAIIEEALLEIMYIMPFEGKRKRCIVNKETIKNNVLPQIIDI